MHEGTLVRDLVAKIEELAKSNGAKGVSRVKVQLGAFSHCSPEHFREHFVEEAKGTLAEQATLEVECLSEDLTDPNAQEVVLESIDIIEE